MSEIGRAEPSDGSEELTLPRLLRLTAVAVVLATIQAVAAVPAIPAAGAAGTASTPEIRAEADWVTEAILADGAIAHYPDRVKVRPYLSHFAAIGLVHASQVAGEPRYLDAAWRWLTWYQGHMDSAGYVTDYDMVSGRLVSTGDMDSTDSYAAMFLVALYNAHRATGDASRTAALSNGVAKAIGAILSTQQPDGLTWAKPAYRAKYLMDQAETYAGLRAGAWLAANALADSGLANRATAAADGLKAGIDALWNAGTGSFDWTVHENGVRVPTNWANLYPDALSQVWAVAFGLVDSDSARAKAILARFDTTHPQWDQPAAVDQFDSGAHPVEYWPVAGWAFARTGNQARADVAADRITAGARAAGRSWPFHPMAAGQLIFLRAGAVDLFPTAVPGATAGVRAPSPVHGVASALVLPAARKSVSFPSVRASSPSPSLWPLARIRSLSPSLFRLFRWHVYRWHRF